MAHKSIVDRVLMLAAAVCASALAWQLTVLLTSKGHASAPARTAAAVSVPAAASPPAAAGGPPSAAAGGPPASTAPAVQAAPAQAVRVVYPGPDTGEKTSLKASDPPAPAPTTTPAPAAAPAQTVAALSQPASAASPTPADPAQADGSAATRPSSGVAEQPSEPAAAPTSVDLASAEQPSPAEHPDAGAPAAPEGTLDLNHASVDSLNHLKGVGRIGQAIVSHRPYRSVEDLVKKRVLRRDVYEQIKQQVATQ